MTKAQKKVLSEARAFGLAHGYTLPINSSWLPGSLRASCSVVPDSQNLDTGSYATLKVLAHFLYVSVASACAPANSAPFAELTRGSVSVWCSWRKARMNGRSGVYWA